MNGGTWQVKLNFSSALATAEFSKFAGILSPTLNIRPKHSALTLQTGFTGLRYSRRAGKRVRLGPVFFLVISRESLARSYI